MLIPALDRRSMNPRPRVETKNTLTAGLRAPAPWHEHGRHSRPWTTYPASSTLSVFFVAFSASTRTRMQKQKMNEIMDISNKEEK